MVSPLPKVIPLPSKSIGMHAATWDRVVLVFKNDTEFPCILLNKGQNSYLYPRQILSGIMCQSPPHVSPPSMPKSVWITL